MYIINGDALRSLALSAFSGAVTSLPIGSNNLSHCCLWKYTTLTIAQILVLQIELSLSNALKIIPPKFEFIPRIFRLITREFQ